MECILKTTFYDFSTCNANENKQFAHQHNINEAIVLGFYQHDINLYSIKSSISREIK